MVLILIYQSYALRQKQLPTAGYMTMRAVTHRLPLPAAKYTHNEAYTQE